MHACICCTCSQCGVMSVFSSLLYIQLKYCIWSLLDKRWPCNINLHQKKSFTVVL